MDHGIISISFSSILYEYSCTDHHHKGRLYHQAGFSITATNYIAPSIYVSGDVSSRLYVSICKTTRLNCEYATHSKIMNSSTTVPVPYSTVLAGTVPYSQVDAGGLVLVVPSPGETDSDHHRTPATSTVATELRYRTVPSRTSRRRRHTVVPGGGTAMSGGAVLVRQQSD